MADKEFEAGVHFRIVETGGRTVKSVVQRSNQTATAACTDDRCISFRQDRGEGGDCCGGEVKYEVERLLCPEEEKDCGICLLEVESMRTWFELSNLTFIFYEHFV